MADDHASQRPSYRGSGGSPENHALVESWTPGTGYADSWGPYHQVLFPPHQVTPWIRFKIMTSGVNIGRRLWAEREALRADYEVAHGVDPEAWPQRHPVVALESVQSIAHAACLGCQWLDRRGTSTSAAGLRAAAARHPDSAD